MGRPAAMPARQEGDGEKTGCGTTRLGWARRDARAVGLKLVVSADMGEPGDIGGFGIA